MGGYAVDPAGLGRADALLGADAGHARETLAELRSSAHELFARWHGPAAMAFRLGWRQWLDGVGTMLDALDEMAAALGAAGADYAITDDAVRSAAAGAVT